ncbi:MAG: glutamate--tRNA ligase family protein [Planctomycetota bacterium]
MGRLGIGRFKKQLKPRIETGFISPVSPNDTTNAIDRCVICVVITRIAPSPTGALHLGNARTFLINWALARRAGWKVLLRFDDLDGPRVRQSAVDQARQDLEWLGLDWDEELPLPSTRLDRYREMLRSTRVERCMFACSCTRSQLEARQPKRAQDGSVIYDGHCSEANLERVADACLRMQVPASVDVVTMSGTADSVPIGHAGAFVVRRVGGAPAYQWTSAIDDHDAQITDIVRGTDLRLSSARQAYLRTLISPTAPAIRHLHVPLVVGPDGRKLSKRHGDTRLAHLREAGWSAGRVRGLCGFWTGIAEEGDELKPTDWVERLDIRAIPKDNIVFSPADHGIASS